MDRRNKLISLAETVYGLLPHTDDAPCEYELRNLSDVHLIQFIDRISDLHDMLEMANRHYGHLVIDWRMFTATVKYP